MPTSWISFGPDLEPMASEARGAVQRPAPRRDGLSVSGTSEAVAAKLAQALASGALCALEEVLSADHRRSVYVNGAAVRLVVDED